MVRGLIEPPSDDCLRRIVETFAVVDDRAIVRLSCGHRETVALSRAVNPNPLKCKSCENRSPHNDEGYRHPLVDKF